MREGGTARGIRLPGIEVSGKSGTAQVNRLCHARRVGKQKQFEDNAWFVATRPRPANPELWFRLVQGKVENTAARQLAVVRD